MALAYDASSTSENGATTSLTWAHTCTGSNLILLVGVLTNDTTDKVTGVTYNGVAMTRLSSQAAVTTGFLGFIYYKIAPATGANNIVVSRSDTGVLGGMGYSITGADQAAPDSHAEGTDATGNFSATTTVVAANCWLFAHARSDNSTSGITAGADTTVRQGVFSAAGVIADSAATVGTGAQSLNFATNPGGQTYWLVASIAPVPPNSPSLSPSASMSPSASLSPSSSASPSLSPSSSSSPSLSPSSSASPSLSPSSSSSPSLSPSSSASPSPSPSFPPWESDEKAATATVVNDTRVTFASVTNDL